MKLTPKDLSVQPNANQHFQKIYLTTSKSAWITIEWIPTELLKYSTVHYDKLYHLKPQERGKVVLFEKEVPSQRWHRSYMNTPKTIPKNGSYMYSGKDLASDSELPNEFLPFLDFMNTHETSDLYNQVITNWYANGNDFIAAHSDCVRGMKPNAEIAIITLNEDSSVSRELRFTAKNLKDEENDSIYKNVKIQTFHGCVITMHGDTQQKFRHKVPKSINTESSRISLTFRKFNQ